MTVRVAMMTGVLLTALLLATSIAPFAAIAGWRPDLITLTVIGFALADGSGTGARYGFVAGLAIDLLSGTGHIVGLSSLALLSVGYVVGMLRPYLTGTAVAGQVVVGAGGTMVAVLTHGLAAMLLDVAPPQPLALLEAAFWTGLYSAVLAPFVIAAVTALSKRLPRPAAPSVRT